ncbi:MAG: hypothetical protein U1C74_26975 [Phenylobacterium sp.]|nr:hypothetical protein [Phenylobacterium sp.]
MFTPEVMYGVGALLLLAAIGYGMWRSKTRNRANDPITEAATREEYDHPDTYQKKEEAFRDHTRPS